MEWGGSRSNCCAVEESISSLMAAKLHFRVVVGVAASCGKRGRGRCHSVAPNNRLTSCPLDRQILSAKTESAPNECSRGSGYEPLVHSGAVDKLKRAIL